MTPDSLNVREAPTLDAPIVGILYHNQRVLVLDTAEQGWARIGAPERGYVARQYLEPPAAPRAEQPGAN